MCVDCGCSPEPSEINCRCCNKLFYDSSPHVVNNDETITCPTCAFINGEITEEECKKLEYYWLGVTFHLTITDGKVKAISGKKREYDRRFSPEYKDWRTSVFSRDNYTCVNCGQVGGELNAHHIKPYKKYKDLRLCVDNGVTLCVICHKKEHKVRK